MGYDVQHTETEGRRPWYQSFEGSTICRGSHSKCLPGHVWLCLPLSLSASEPPGLCVFVCARARDVCARMCACTCVCKCMCAHVCVCTCVFLFPSFAEGTSHVVNFSTSKSQWMLIKTTLRSSQWGSSGSGRSEKSVSQSECASISLSRRIVK